MDENEIRTRLEDIGRQHYELSKKSVELEAELECILVNRLLESKQLNTLTWSCSVPSEPDQFLHVTAEEHYPECLNHLFAWDHSSVEVCDVKIGWFDGEPYISGSIEDVLSFIRDQGIRVNFEGIDKAIKNLTEQLKWYQSLKEIVSRE